MVEIDSWWGREFEPPNLATLNARLREHFGVGPTYIGSKGDLNHDYGYHRSREWILNSRWSAYKANDYSVQHELDQQGDARWLCATDFQTLGGVPELIEVCKRLDAAVRADRCPQIREWYGNVNGDRYVDGWDNIPDQPASSDGSHLWHLHMSFFRGRANDDHSELFEILTGDDMTPEERQMLKDIHYALFTKDSVAQRPEGSIARKIDDIHKRQSGGGGGGPVDLTDAAHARIKEDAFLAAQRAEDE